MVAPSFLTEAVEPSVTTMPGLRAFAFACAYDRPDG
jgi:hypothetical protein